jgi:hypothetical protein
VILEITLSGPAGEIAEGKGEPFEAVLMLRELVEAHGADDLWLSWPIGSGCGQLMIPAGQSFDDAIGGAYAELQDPDLVFDDPAEEDMARSVVTALHFATILMDAEVIVDDGDHSEDAGARYDRYDELEEGESYN